MTNPQRTVIYTGVTNNPAQRLAEHWLNRGQRKTFAGRYNCYNLVYYEHFSCILNALGREREINGLRRQKKPDLINPKNPEWKFLNDLVCKEWPPKNAKTRK